MTAGAWIAVAAISWVGLIVIVVVICVTTYKNNRNP